MLSCFYPTSIQLHQCDLEPNEVIKWLTEKQMESDTPPQSPNEIDMFCYKHQLFWGQDTKCLGEESGTDLW